MHFFSYKVFEIQCIFPTYSTHQSRLATFPVLPCHMWLAATYWIAQFQTTGLRTSGLSGSSSFYNLSNLLPNLTFFSFPLLVPRVSYSWPQLPAWFKPLSFYASSISVWWQSLALALVYVSHKILAFLKEICLRESQKRNKYMKNYIIGQELWSNIG